MTETPSIDEVQALEKFISYDGSATLLRTFQGILRSHEEMRAALSTPPADDVREALDGDVKALMGRLWVAADNAGVSREAVEFEWPECHKPRCQGSHGLPDVAMSYMKRAIMAEIERELRYRLTTRPDHAPDTDSAEQAAALNLATLLSNHNVHDEGTFIRAAERMVEAYPELVPVLSGREVRPHGTVTEAETPERLAERYVSAFVGDRADDSSTIVYRGPLLEMVTNAVREAAEAAREVHP